MKPQSIIIEKKKFLLLPEKEYLEMLQDIADLKKVLRRKNEPGMEARIFFRELGAKKK